MFLYLQVQKAMKEIFVLAQTNRVGDKIQHFF
jgi:hypothetical protein